MTSGVSLLGLGQFLFDHLDQVLVGGLVLLPAGEVLELPVACGKFVDPGNDHQSEPLTIGVLQLFAKWPGVGEHLA